MDGYRDPTANTINGGPHSTFQLILCLQGHIVQLILVRYHKCIEIQTFYHQTLLGALVIRGPRTCALHPLFGNPPLQTKLLGLMIQLTIGGSWGLDFLPLLELSRVPSAVCHCDCVVLTPPTPQGPITLSSLLCKVKAVFLRCRHYQPYQSPSHSSASVGCCDIFLLRCLL